MSLAGVELVRRFLLHVLPKGFVRIRHFGFLANRARQQELPRVRALIAGQHARPSADQDAALRTPAPERPAAPDDRCPCCDRGRMRVVARIPSGGEPIHDTS